MKRTILAAAAACLLWAVFAPGARPEGDCPGSSALAEMTSDNATFMAAQPFDLSRIKSAGALLKKNGTQLGVYLSNGEFSVEQMASSFVVPIKENGVFIVAINFSNGPDPIAPGVYSPTAGFGKPFWATAEVKVAREEKGAIVSLGVREGTAEIVRITENSVCGRFALRLLKKDGQVSGAISGEFNVPLEISPR